LPMEAELTNEYDDDDDVTKLLSFVTDGRTR
jgi:hypothetical protein